MEENLYFAYGSNLDLEQMAQRCPDAEIVGPVRLENYELRFRGSGAILRSMFGIAFATTGFWFATGADTENTNVGTVVDAHRLVEVGGDLGGTGASEHPPQRATDYE